MARVSGELGRAREVFCGAAINRCEIRSASHRMHEVIRGVHARKRGLERLFVETIPLNDTGGRRCRVETTRLTRQAAHCAATVFEASQKAAADVSRGASQ